MSDINKRLEESLLSDFRLRLASEIGVMSRLCESPIEVMLGSAIAMADLFDDYGSPKIIICSQGEEEAHYGPEARLLIPQYKIDGYRLDFVLKEPPFMVAIECDGHDFHERTKQQAARDRQKDRAIQHGGMHILRFTGSEINRDPSGCAHQALFFAIELHIPVEHRCGRA
jgi:hypothetical protein